jgi:integrase
MDLPPTPTRIIRTDWATHKDSDWLDFDRRYVDALNRFIAYMESRNYAAHTVSDYFIRVRRSLKYCGNGDLMDYILVTQSPSEAKARQQALRVWAQFVGDQVLAERIKEWRIANTSKDGPKGGRVPRQGREALDDDVFVAIRRLALADPDPRGVVVAIMTITPLRIGDVLRITRVQAKEGVRTGKMKLVLKGGRIVEYAARPIGVQLGMLLAMGDWEQVQNLFGSGTYSAASKQIGRRLKRYGRKIGYDGDLFLHLLRYSGIMRIAIGDGVMVASAVAGHASVNTTARYLTKNPPLEQQEAALTKGMAG